MATTTMMATITEVIQVSRLVVQVTLRASARTSRANWAMLVRFLGAARAAAEGEAITAAVLAARLRMADGLLPGFLAMAASSNSRFSSGLRTSRPTFLHI